MNPVQPQSLNRTRAQLASDFLEQDRLYSALCDGCSREQILWRPADASWSIAECVEHVALSIAHYLSPIRDAIARGVPPAPADDYLFSPGGWFSATFLRRIGPQVTLKMKAPGKIRPHSLDPEKALQSLRAGHAEIQTLLEQTSGLDLNRIRFRNPFIPILRFTVATGFLVMAAHGRRHLLQAQRVTSAEGFPQNKAQQSA